MLGLKNFVYAGGKHGAQVLTKRDQLQLIEKYEVNIVFSEDLLNRELSTRRKMVSENGDAYPKYYSLVAPMLMLVWN